MRVTVRSFAKINLGLQIGALRPDGFHELRTVYQTIALHDIIRVGLGRGGGMEVRCEDPRVPTNDANTCCRLLERALVALKVRARVIVEIEKRLPVQGGLGGASSNAVAALLAVERLVKKSLSPSEKLRIAAEVGSDLPLFLIGGTVLGVGRGEEVYPLPDILETACVVATPEVGISTPRAFADWDLMPGGAAAQGSSSRDGAGMPPGSTLEKRTPILLETASYPKLTPPTPSDRMLKFGRAVSAWLSGWPQSIAKSGRAVSGVPVRKRRGRAETPLLDLVRTGIENDFEQVVFPKYPELREVKSVLKRAGAAYASLSGSGSAVYGLFASRAAAEKAAAELRERRVPAQVTSTLARQQYWKQMF